LRQHISAHQNNIAQVCEALHVGRTHFGHDTPTQAVYRFAAAVTTSSEAVAALNCFIDYCDNKQSRPTSSLPYAYSQDLLSTNPGKQLKVAFLFGGQVPHNSSLVIRK